MTEPHVTFYFAYNSPYAFLANTRIEEALAPYDVALVRKPVHSPRPGGQQPDFSNPRMSYTREDVGRIAEAYGLALDPGPFSDSGKACRGFLFAEQEGVGKAYHDRLYEARWLEGKDIGDDAALAAIAAHAGLDGAAFLAATAATSPQAAALENCNAEAESDGVFGFPFFVFAGQHFWGNDRIEWLVQAIAKPPEA